MNDHFGFRQVTDVPTKDYNTPSIADISAFALTAGNLITFAVIGWEPAGIWALCCAFLSAWVLSILVRS